MSGKSRHQGPRDPGKRKPNPLFVGGQVPGAPGKQPPWITLPGNQPPWPPGSPPPGGPISQLMSYMQAQPQLIVCGRLNLEPLKDAERRGLLSGVNLLDAVEAVARLQGQWDVEYTTTQRAQTVSKPNFSQGQRATCAGGLVAMSSGTATFSCRLGPQPS